MQLTAPSTDSVISWLYQPGLIAKHSSGRAQILHSGAAKRWITVSAPKAPNEPSVCG